VADANATLKHQVTLGMDKEHDVAAAPFAGVVRTVNVSVGDRIASGAAIMQLSPDDALVARLGVEPEDSHRIKAGAAARVSSVFDTAHSIAGKVRRVHRVLNPQTRMVDVLVDIKGDEAAFFLPGMQVAGEIALESRTSLAAPRSAVLRDGGGAYIFQVKDDHAHKVYVQTGIESAGFVGISGDFDKKLEVVTEGNYELEEGMAVRQEKP
jgi:RND family efflux transporter MFP subunit